MAKAPLFPQFPHFLHGADYNPEQWIADKSVWDADMALMKGAHCNVMTVGIFSWSFLEPSDGVYDFSFLDEIIEKIYESGGRVILATPSAARPPWLCDKYPEVLRVTKQLPSLAELILWQILRAVLPFGCATLIASKIRNFPTYRSMCTIGVLT